MTPFEQLLAIDSRLREIAPHHPRIAQVWLAWALGILTDAQAAVRLDELAANLIRSLS